MRQTTRQAIQVLRRAHEFLAANKMATVLGDTSKPVEALGEGLERLSAHAVEQDGKNRALGSKATEARSRARSLRSDLMRPVARMARTLFPDDLEIRRALQMPKARDYERVLAAALAMADQAELHKARFVAAGFGENFIDGLRKGAADLRAALDEKGANIGKRAAATAGLDDELARCKDLVYLLDLMILPTLQATPDRLAEWRALSRFVRPKKGEEEGTTPQSDVPNASTPVIGAPPTGTTIGSPITTTLTPDALEDGTPKAKAA